MNNRCSGLTRRSLVQTMNNPTILARFSWLYRLFRRVIIFKIINGLHIRSKLINMNDILNTSIDILYVFDLLKLL